MGTGWVITPRSVHVFGTEIAIRASKYVEARLRARLLRGAGKVVVE